MPKKKIVIFIYFIFIASIVSPQVKYNSLAEVSKKKFVNRAESFFGLHFDFHASEKDTLIGKTFKEESIDSMLSLIKPDYIQVDCKGHPGISSYPTKIGNSVGHFEKDIYPIWRKETAKHGVGLFVHYSGILDNEAVKKHPEWAMLNKEGKIIEGKNSSLGPYADKLLIPQMKELIDNYKIDGAWVDGESWALELDYSKYMVDAFQKETGINNIPLSEKEYGWQEFRTFNRNSFRKYISHYVNELHLYDPKFEITSNWAFSSFMPQPIDVNIDFISGDFDPNNSLYSGLFESRCIAPQEKPWDLMVWSFTHDNEGTYVYKSPLQLKKAAAAVISMGGGFQIYSTQNRDGSIKPWLFETLKEVGDFCRERQPFTQNAKPIPQIALLYSTANFEKNSGPLYSSSGKIHDPLRGILNLLLDSQNAVEILMEHHLQNSMNEYPLIIIPETQYLTEEFKKELLEYVNGGGDLLIIGADATRLFADQLNIDLTKEANYLTKFLSWDGEMAGVRGWYQPTIPNNNIKTIGKLFDEPDFRFESSPAAAIFSYGKGKIAGVYFDIGKYYLKMNNPVYKNFINDIVKVLFPNPKVEVKGSENVVITVNELENKLMVNLINMSGPHANTRVARYDTIPPIGPLDIKIRLSRKPIKVVLQPENIILNYTYENGELKTQINRIDIHSIIVIE
ncbi:MAG: alpha-amylase family protein [Melioribacteraceae bacterium]